MRVFISILLIILFISSFSQDTLVETELVLTKKERRVEKRFVHPKSVFIQVGSAMFANKVKMSRENDVFQRSFFMYSALNFSLKAEIGTKNNFFYEIGCNYNTYDEFYILKDIGFYTAKRHAFNSLNFHGGYGKRIILKNNINLFNVQIGGSIGFNLKSPVKSNSIDNNEPIYASRNPFVFGDKPSTVRRVFPTIYIEISKDIRVYKRFYVTMSYRYDQGFISTYQQKFRYVNNSSETEEVDNNITGTAHSLMFGFKYRFLPKKYRKN